MKMVRAYGEWLGRRHDLDVPSRVNDSSVARPSQIDRQMRQTAALGALFVGNRLFGAVSERRVNQFRADEVRLMRTDDKGTPMTARISSMICLGPTPIPGRDMVRNDARPVPTPTFSRSLVESRSSGEPP